VNLSPRSNTEVKGKVLTRLVQLAMRGIFSGVPADRLTELLALIALIEDRTTAVEVLESLLRYYVQGTRQIDEPTACALLQQHSHGDPIMQTFIERYIEQGKQLGLERGRQEGQATLLLRLIERKFGPPSEAVLERIASADQDMLLRWSDRILTAESLDVLLH
jgi:predicted transposase YdaD